MAEYIDREVTAQILREEAANHYPTPYHIGLLAAARAVDAIPAADVRPVVRAVWRRYSPFTDTYECSNCGEQVIDQQFRTNFCPNCGAEMEES
jgi:NADH pyrophosphatase NudC (nudix superfamily)